MLKQSVELSESGEMFVKFLYKFSIVGVSLNMTSATTSALGGKGESKMTNHKKCSTYYE
jgi:hypothetical protein